MMRCVLAVCVLAGPVWAQDEAEPPAPPFEVHEFEPGADGHLSQEEPGGPGSWLAVLYAIGALGLVVGPAFKDAKRTHLD